MILRAGPRRLKQRIAAVVRRIAGSAAAALRGPFTLCLVYLTGLSPVGPPDIQNRDTVVDCAQLNEASACIYARWFFIQSPWPWPAPVRCCARGAPNVVGSAPRKTCSTRTRTVGGLGPVAALACSVSGLPRLPLRWMCLSVSGTQLRLISSEDRPHPPHARAVLPCHQQVIPTAWRVVLSRSLTCQRRAPAMCLRSNHSRGSCSIMAFAVLFRPRASTSSGYA